MLNAKSTKVSVIGFTRKKLRCLNENDVLAPKNSPIDNEINPSIMNSPMIVNGVAAVI
jgi:hypothetical protein